MTHRFSHPRVSVFSGGAPLGQASLLTNLYRLVMLGVTISVLAVSAMGPAPSISDAVNFVTPSGAAAAR